MEDGRWRAECGSQKSEGGAVTGVFGEAPNTTREARVFPGTDYYDEAADFFSCVCRARS
jgi:hypothetical protein